MFAGVMKPSTPPRRLRTATRQAIASVFERQDYAALEAIYCYDGGDEFWREKRGPCQRLGIKLAEVLLGRLRPDGRSLYVGAGVAEIPMLAMETMDLGREVAAYNLREEEVTLLNQACKPFAFRFMSGDARAATGRFDHLWIVSVLNDPERFPHLSALSYGQTHPVAFDTVAFAREREEVFAHMKPEKIILPFVQRPHRRYRERLLADEANELEMFFQEFKQVNAGIARHGCLAAGSLGIGRPDWSGNDEDAIRRQRMGDVLHELCRPLAAQNRERFKAHDHVEALFARPERFALAGFEPEVGKLSVFL